MVVLQIIAAQEPVFICVAIRHKALSAPAYHLVIVMCLTVGNGWLRLEQDHVLKRKLFSMVWG